MTMMSNLVQNHILHWFKPVTFYPNLPKYTFYSEGIVNFMPTLDGEVADSTAASCSLALDKPRQKFMAPQCVYTHCFSWSSVEPSRATVESRDYSVRNLES